VNDVEAWAEANNLTLNRNKSVEIVFTTKRKRQFIPPPLLSGITRITSMKMLGVTISDKLSVSDHVQNTVSSCAQSVHALRTLRAHGMSQEDIQTVSRCVVVTKLTYAANAWWGFGTAADGQRVEAVLRRGEHSGLCRSDILTAAELIEDLDDDLFQRILRDKNHLLHALIPDRRRSLDYGLRPCSHDRELVPKASSLIESNFFIRQLYKDCY